MNILIKLSSNQEWAEKYVKANREKHSHLYPKYRLSMCNLAAARPAARIAAALCAARSLNLELG
jgi:hypothetical protein